MAEYLVVYRAVANFADLAREARKAREEIRKLKDQEAELTRSRARGETGVAGEKRRAGAVRGVADEMRKAAKVEAEHAAAARASAKASDADARAQQRAATALQRQLAAIERLGKARAEAARARARAVGEERASAAKAVAEQKVETAAELASIKALGRADAARTKAVEKEADQRRRVRLEEVRRNAALEMQESRARARADAVRQQNEARASAARVKVAEQDAQRRHRIQLESVRRNAALELEELRHRNRAEAVREREALREEARARAARQRATGRVSAAASRDVASVARVELQLEDRQFRLEMAELTEDEEKVLVAKLRKLEVERQLAVLTRDRTMEIKVKEDIDLVRSKLVALRANLVEAQRESRGFFAALAGGGGRGRSPFGGFIKSADDAGRRLAAFTPLTRRIIFAISALIFVAGQAAAALAGLGAAALGLVSALGQLAATAAALPGIFAALGAAIAGVVVAMQGVPTAFKEFAEAQKAVAEGGEKAVEAQSKYLQSLEKLSPAARTFVTGMVSLRDAWKSVQQAVQERFFAPFADDVYRLNLLFPTLKTLLGDAAGALGQVAEKALKVVTSGPWRRDFQTLSKTNVVVIRALGDAALSVADAFRHIAVAAAPFTQWIVKGIAKAGEAFADWAEKARGTGQIARSLESFKPTIESLVNIVGKLGKVFVNILHAFKPLGDWLLDWLESNATAWADVTREGTPFFESLQRWAESIKPLLQEIFGLFGDVAGEFAKIAADPKQIESSVRLFQTLRKDVLPALVDLINSLAESEIPQTIVETIGQVADAISRFLESGASGVIVAAIKNFGDIVSVVAKVLSWGPIPVILGTIAFAWGALAAASAVGRLTGVLWLGKQFAHLIGRGGGLNALLRSIGVSFGFVGKSAAAGSVGVGRMGTALRFLGGSVAVIGALTIAMKAFETSAGEQKVADALQAVSENAVDARDKLRDVADEARSRAGEGFGLTGQRDPSKADPIAEWLGDINPLARSVTETSRDLDKQLAELDATYQRMRSTFGTTTEESRELAIAIGIDLTKGSEDANAKITALDDIVKKLMSTYGLTREEAVALASKHVSETGVMAGAWERMVQRINAANLEEAQQEFDDLAGKLRGMRDQYDSLVDEEQAAAEQIVQTEQAVQDAYLDAARSREASADRIRDAGRAVEDAQQGIIDAEEAVKDAHYGVVEAEEALEEAHYGVLEAENKLKDAHYAVVEAQEKIRDAHREVKDAEEGLVDSHKEVKDAEKDLAEARKEALRDLEDLRQAVRNQAVEELDVKAKITKAHEDYRKTLADANASEGDRQQALAGLQGAEADYRDLLLEGRRNREDLRDAERKGVEGSDKVVSAQNALKQAHIGVRDAARELEKAHQGVRGANRDLLKAHQDVRDAERGVTEAHRGVRDAARNLEKAHDAVRDADRDLRKAHRDLRDAERELTRAHRDARIEADRQAKAIDTARKAAQKAKELFDKIHDQRIKLEMDIDSFQKAVDEAYIKLSALKQVAATGGKITYAQAESNARRDLAQQRRGRAFGGLVGSEWTGPGWTGRSGPTKQDHIPAMLASNEYVQQSSAVSYYGLPFMEAINKQRIPREMLSGALGRGVSAVVPPASMPENALVASLVRAIDGFPDRMRAGFRAGGLASLDAVPSFDVRLSPELPATMANVLALSLPEPPPPADDGGTQDTAGTLGTGMLSAVAWAAKEAAYASRNWFNLCLKFVRTAFGAPGGVYDANTSYRQTKHKRGTSGPVPAGVPVWWTSKTHGHVALSSGQGYAYSTDILRRGKVDKVLIKHINDKWGMPYKGWTEDINSKRVFTPAKAPGGGGGGGGLGVDRWAGVVLNALQIVGQSRDNLDITLKRMKQESGGNERVVNKWDSNWKRGTPSVGLMQVIGPTYRSYVPKKYDRGPYLYGVSTDPLANILSSMKYALARYGSLSKAYGRKGGYASGGPVLDDFDFPGFVLGGLAPVQTRVPRPRQLSLAGLSQAAQQVTNNRGFQTGDIVINNPVQERSGDSLYRTVFKLANLGEW